MAIRKTWNSYFIDLAYVVATRSTCTRRKVGAVVVDPVTRSIIATGYNGSLPGADHCEDVGCHLVNGSCTRTIHAETNAINQAAKSGATLQQAHIYCTTKPCWNCFKNIIQAGIYTIYYREDYNTKSYVLYEKYLQENSHIHMEKI